METILQEIIRNKRKEVEVLKEKFNYADFEKAAHFNNETLSLKQSLIDAKFGVIAEIKRKSPSAGSIREDLNVAELGLAYQNGGAAGISCLTDYNYFGGSTDDILALKNAVNIPVLRKEFIIDEFQLFESKAVGADAVLLIAEALTKEEALHLTIMAQSLGLEVIMEFHNRKEIAKLNDQVDIVGINNRDLHIQKTDIKTSFELIEHVPENSICISESGIRTAEEICQLAEAGFSGALIGESILTSSSPKDFTAALQEKTKVLC